MHTPDEVEGLYPVAILGVGVPPASPNPEPISDQKRHFHTRFQTSMGRNYVIIT